MNVNAQAITPLGDAALRIDVRALFLDEKEAPATEDAAKGAAEPFASCDPAASAAAADPAPEEGEGDATERAAARPFALTPMAAWRALTEARVPGFTDVSFSYQTVLVQYDPLQLTYAQATAAAVHALETAQPGERAGRTFAIPVLYGGEAGPDLAELCEQKNLDPQEFVRLHSAPDYRITTIGFMPGFAYLSGLDPRLAAPRKAQPRLQIKPGSIGIAVDQTGIYPLQSPGGWQIIGRTPLKVFDPARTPSVLYQAGDVVRFVPVDQDRFNAIEHEAESGTFDYESMVTA